MKLLWVLLNRVMLLIKDKDLLILVLAGRICISDLILVGVCSIITYHLMSRVHILINGEITSSRQWQDTKWN